MSNPISFVRLVVARPRRHACLVACALALWTWTAAPGPAAAQTADPIRLERIDALVEEAIAAGQLPGAAVLVGRGDEIVYRKVFGNRSLSPTRETMTFDTVFDLASLTKVVATTTSVMQLVETGRIRLSDRVTAFIPEFGRYGKSDVTIRHLLTHTSGLRPDLPLEDEFDGTEVAIRRAVGSCTVPRSMTASGPSQGQPSGGHASVGAIRGASEDGGLNIVSSMPSGPKIRSRT